MKDFFDRVGHGLRFLQLYVLFRGLMIGGLAYMAMGAFSLFDSGHSVTVAPRVLTGVVVRKMEAPIPGFDDRKAYSVEIAPLHAPDRPVTRQVGEERWNEINPGDRWSDPVPASAKRKASRSGDSPMRGLVVGLMMIAMAAFVRRGMRSAREGLSASKAPSAPQATTGKTEFGLDDIKRLILAKVEAYKLKERSTRAPTPAAPPPRYKVRPARSASASAVRPSTVTRPGWF